MTERQGEGPMTTTTTKILVIRHAESLTITEWVGLG